MRDLPTLESFLSQAQIDAAVAALRPDYRALLIAVDGIEPGPGDSKTERLMQQAEESVRKALVQLSVEELPHVAAWRDAYRAFGAKPQRTRNSLEALLRRAEARLPRVNRLTDVYNAISVLHQVPLGGEDLDRYVGPPRLTRATGKESFDTTSGGEDVTEHPELGEVVWCDDAGVTCRRWNWRQAKRTQLTDATTSAIFILDALEPLNDSDLEAAADDLSKHLSDLGPDVRIARRLLGSK